MTDFSNYAELRTLDFWFNANSQSTTAPTTVYVSLHTADPGDTGASEASGSGYARIALSFGAASTATDGTTNISSDADATFAAFSGSFTFTHMGIWDSLSGGNFLAGGALSTSRSVVSGDQLKFSSGNVTVALD